MSKLKFEVTKFTIVGVYNAVFTFVIFFSLYKLFKINYLIAFSLSWVLGVIFSYTLNFLWVFKPELRLQFKSRFIKYFLAYLMSFLLNLFLLNYIVEFTCFDPFYVQITLIPLIVVINFTVSKFWSLRSKNI